MIKQILAHLERRAEPATPACRPFVRAPPAVILFNLNIIKRQLAHEEQNEYRSENLRQRKLLMEQARSTWRAIVSNVPLA